MIPIRPLSVSQDAALVYPGQTFQPGIGVQFNTLQSFQSQVDHSNRLSDLNYARALSDWKENASRYADCHLVGPPAPPLPIHGALKITYANLGGTVVTDEAVIDSGMTYAWVEEVYK